MQNGNIHRSAPWGLALLSTLLISVLLFGDPLKPLAYTLGLWPMPVPIGLIGAAFALGVLAATLGVFLLYRIAPRPAAQLSAPTLFAVIIIGAAFAVISFEMHRMREQVIKQFAPDRVTTRPFIESLRNAPAEYQFYLHGAALKDCVPYAWSYSEMNFYVLTPDVAVNVLPPDWVKECGIVRTG